MGRHKRSRRGKRNLAKRIRNASRQNTRHKKLSVGSTSGRPSRQVRNRWRKLLVWPWNAVEALVLVLGLGGLFYLLPSVDIAPSSGYERGNDPMYAALSLTNNGYLSIHPQKVTCYIYRWRNATGSSIGSIAFDYFGGGTIKRSERVDFVPDPPIKESKAFSAHFVLVIQFHRVWW